MQPCKPSPCTAPLFLWTPVNFLEKRSSFICHIQYWKREREDLKRQLPSSFLTVTEIMSGTKADSWQEMQSRRLIQLPCKPTSEDKNAELCVWKAQEEPWDETRSLVWSMSTEALPCFQKVQRTRKQGRNKKETTQRKSRRRKKFPYGHFLRIFAATVWFRV